MSKKNIILLGLALFLLVQPVVVFSQGDAAAAWFRGIIVNFLNIIVWPIFVGAAIIMLIWAGVMFLTAQGDPGKIDLARKAVVWAMIGIFVGLLGFVAVGIIRNIIPKPPQNQAQETEWQG